MKRIKLIVCQESLTINIFEHQIVFAETVLTINQFKLVKLLICNLIKLIVPINHPDIWLNWVVMASDTKGELKTDLNLGCCTLKSMTRKCCFITLHT